jgi:hypothetical protein
MVKRSIWILCAFLFCLASSWWYQATLAKNLVSFDVPDWIIGNTNRNVSYSVAIHKSQIKPWGTLWKATTYPDIETHFPQIK